MASLRTTSEAGATAAGDSTRGENAEMSPTGKADTDDDRPRTDLTTDSFTLDATGKLDD